MNKKVRKAVRTFLINDNNIVVTKYNTKINLDFYDIPGGKIEENETSEQASIREFKEETGITIISQKMIGHAIIEYPERIFDFDIFIVEKFEGDPLNFEENDSMWMSIDELLSKDKKIPSVEIVKYLDNNIKLKINSDDNHNILSIEK